MSSSDLYSSENKGVLLNSDGSCEKGMSMSDPASVPTLDGVVGHVLAMVIGVTGGKWFCQL